MRFGMSPWHSRQVETVGDGADDWREAIPIRPEFDTELATRYENK